MAHFLELSNYYVMCIPPELLLLLLPYAPHYLPQLSLGCLFHFTQLTVHWRLCPAQQLSHTIAHSQCAQIGILHIPQ
eukprot:13284577-Ditylum_brightwellii.AAC.1